MFRYSRHCYSHNNVFWHRCVTITVPLSLYHCHCLPSSKGSAITTSTCRYIFHLEHIKVQHGHFSTGKSSLKYLQKCKIQPLMICTYLPDDFSVCSKLSCQVDAIFSLFIIRLENRKTCLKMLLQHQDRVTGAGNIRNTLRAPTHRNTYWKSHDGAPKADTPRESATPRRDGNQTPKFRRK